MLKGSHNLFVLIFKKKIKNSHGQFCVIQLKKIHKHKIKKLSHFFYKKNGWWTEKISMIGIEIATNFELMKL